MSHIIVDKIYIKIDFTILIANASKFLHDRAIWSSKSYTAIKTTTRNNRLLACIFSLNCALSQYYYSLQLLYTCNHLIEHKTLRKGNIFNIPGINYYRRKSDDKEIFEEFQVARYFAPVYRRLF